MLVNVKGGTGAGAQMNRKQHKDWQCGCKGKTHPGSRYSCPDCGKRRS